MDGNTLRRRELECTNEVILDLPGSRLDQTRRMGPVLHSVRVAGMRGNEGGRVALLVHVSEYAAGHHAAINPERAIQYERGAFQSP